VRLCAIGVVDSFFGEDVADLVIVVGESAKCAVGGLFQAIQFVIGV